MTYASDEEREAAALAAKLRAKQKTKNMTIDADLVPLLNRVADKLETEFGFRPTLSQSIRHLIKSNLEK